MVDTESRSASNGRKRARRDAVHADHSLAGDGHDGLVATVASAFTDNARWRDAPTLRSRAWRFMNERRAERSACRRAGSADAVAALAAPNARPRRPRDGAAEGSHVRREPSAGPPSGCPARPSTARRSAPPWRGPEGRRQVGTAAPQRRDAPVGALPMYPGTTAIVPALRSGRSVRCASFVVCTMFGVAPPCCISVATTSAASTYWTRRRARLSAAARIAADMRSPLDTSMSAARGSICPSTPTATASARYSRAASSIVASSRRRSAPAGATRERSPDAAAGRSPLCGPRPASIRPRHAWRRRAAGP